MKQTREFIKKNKKALKDIPSTVLRRERRCK